MSTMVRPTRRVLASEWMCIGKVKEPNNTSEGFEDLAWLFTCDSRNRGLIRQGFDEAALLWKAIKATSGRVLEIGRNLAGSTVLLAAAAGPDREIYSIDNRSNEDRACKDYLSQPMNRARRSEKSQVLWRDRACCLAS